MLFAALVAGWWQLWHVREDVTSAYTTARPELALELDGIGIALASSEPSVSPYALVPTGAERAPTFPASPSTSIVATDEIDETTSVEVTGGEVELAGIVQLVDGTPVAGATVRIERFTSQGSGTAETVSGSDGAWEASGLQGGRLRVRAYAPNQLASIDPVVLVVTRTGSASVDLTVGQADLGITFEMVGPPGMAIGATTTVAVVMSRVLVDELGRFVEQPVAGASTTGSVSGARLLSADALTTDVGGAVRYLLACDIEGAPSISIAVGGATSDAAEPESERAVVALPECMSAELLAELEAAAATEGEGVGEGEREPDPIDPEPSQ